MDFQRFISKHGAPLAASFAVLLIMLIGKPLSFRVPLEALKPSKKESSSLLASSIKQTPQTESGPETKMVSASKKSDAEQTTTGANASAAKPPLATASPPLSGISPQVTKKSESSSQPKSEVITAPKAPAASDERRTEQSNTTMKAAPPKSVVAVDSSAPEKLPTKDSIQTSQSGAQQAVMPKPSDGAAADNPAVSGTSSSGMERPPPNTAPAKPKLETAPTPIIPKALPVDDDVEKKIVVLPKPIAGTESFYGIGVTFGPPGQQARIVEVVPGGPASLSGIKTGDVLLEVDEIRVSGLTVDDLISHTRSDRESRVKLRVVRDGMLREFWVNRTKITTAKGQKPVIEPKPNGAIMGYKPVPNPWRYRVAAGGDTLTVRSGPGTLNKDIGKLAPHQEVWIVGEAVSNGPDYWVPIEAGALSGWVNRKFIAPAPRY